MGLGVKDQKAIITFCKDNHISHKLGWSNFTGSVALPNTLVLDIQTEKQVVALAKLVHQLNIKKDADDIITYRAAAAGENTHRPNERYDRKSYSMTPCMEADILLHLRGPQFHGIKVINGNKRIVNVGVSVQIGDLDRQLYNNHQMNLPTSSLIPWITIGGAVATGVHGTGRHQPSVAGLVHSMRIVRPDGEIVMLDNTHPDFETIRGAHLGLFGVVLDMDIQCQKAMKLKIVIETKNIFQFKEAIKQGLYKKNKYVSVAYFTSGQKDEGAKDCPKDVVIIRWEPVPMDTPDSGACTELERLGQKITIMMQEDFHINDLLRKHPHLVPLFKQYLVRPLEVTGQDKTIVVPWPDGAHYQQEFPHDIDDEDDIFPVSEDCHEIIDAIDFAVAKLNAYAEKNDDPSIYAIYLRYFEGTNGGLSTSKHAEGQHVCGFDMTSARNMPGFSEFKTAVRNYVMEKFNAKPHHGKTVPADANYKQIYGSGYDDFIKALGHWLENCDLELDTNPHLNPFFRQHLRIGGTPRLKTEDILNTTHVASSDNVPSHELAQTVLDILHLHDKTFKHDEAAQGLRAQLEHLAATKKVALVKNPSTTFHRRDQKEGELVVVEQKQKSKCCVLL